MPATDRRTYNRALREDAKVKGVRRVSATLSPEEYSRLTASATKAGERVTSHLKTCAFAHLDSKYIVPADIESRLDVLVSITRGIGNNLNQLARNSNEMKMFLDTKDVIQHLRKMELAVRIFLTEPPRADSGKPEE